MEMSGSQQTTQSPLVEPMYITMMPGAAPVEGARFTITSGYAASEGHELHRLSAAVLQLAVVNFILVVTIRFIALAVALAYGIYMAVITFVVDVAFAGLVLYLGVQGVKNRNAACCCDECCGYLRCFYIIYICLAVLDALSFLVLAISGDWIFAMLDLAFLALHSVTAENSRQLLDLLEHLSRNPLPTTTTTSVVHHNPGIPPAASTPAVVVPEAVVQVLGPDASASSSSATDPDKASPQPPTATPL